MGLPNAQTSFPSVTQFSQGGPPLQSDFSMQHGRHALQLCKGGPPCENCVTEGKEVCAFDLETHKEVRPRKSPYKAIFPCSMGGMHCSQAWFPGQQVSCWTECAQILVQHASLVAKPELAALGDLRVRIVFDLERKIVNWFSQGGPPLQNDFSMQHGRHALQSGLVSGATSFLLRI
jgi:hypothetical protein